MEGSLDAKISARTCWRGISGPLHATARRVSVASPLVTAAHICVSASRSGHVLPDSYGDHPLTDPGTAEYGSAGNSIRPSRHALCCIADGALRPTSIRVRSIQHSSSDTSPQHVVRGLRQVPSGLVLCVRFADVARRRPAARRETPAGPVVPGDLDTLPAWAASAGAVRFAVLLVGSRAGPSTDMKEPIPVPIKEKKQ